MLVNSLTDGKTFFRHIRPQPLSLISAAARERTDICTNLDKIGKANQHLITNTLAFNIYDLISKTAQKFL